jgi:hypothetical protein
MTDGWGCLYFRTECESVFTDFLDVVSSSGEYKNIHLIVWFFVACLEMKMSGNLHAIL